MTDKPSAAPQAKEGHPQGSFLDPDVLIFALPLALLIDILDVVLAIGVIVNLIVGIPLMLWMVWKTGELVNAKEQTQNIRQSQRQKQAARKVATRRAFRRGALYFIGGLIPIVSIFVLWTLAVINTVRGK